MSYNDRRFLEMTVEAMSSKGIEMNSEMTVEAMSSESMIKMNSDIVVIDQAP